MPVLSVIHLRAAAYQSPFGGESHRLFLSIRENISHLLRIVEGERFMSKPLASRLYLKLRLFSLRMKEGTPLMIISMSSQRSF